MYKFYAILLVLTLASTGICREKNKIADSNKTPEIKMVAKAEVEKTDPNKVLAIVNGKKIKESDFLDQIMPMLERQLSRVPEEQRQAQKNSMLNSYRPRVLDSLVTNIVIEDALEKAEIKVSDEDINNKIQEMMQQRNMNMPMEQFKSMIESQGQSFDDFKENIKKSVQFEKLVDKKLEGKIEDVNESEAKKFYDENIQRFTVQETVTASHILIDTRNVPEDMNEAKYKAQQKEKAEEILKKVKKGGDFAELAKENSTCPSKSKGGNLGPFTKGRMVPEFEKAAFAMDVNEVSDIVETQFGYHIIKVTDKQKAEVKSFEDVKPQIVGQLQGQQKNKFAMDLIKELKEEAEIKYPADPNK